MVGLSLDREVSENVEEISIDESELIREFGGMSAPDFVYQTLLHLKDAYRANNYFALTDDKFGEKVLMHLNMWGRYGLN